MKKSKPKQKPAPAKTPTLLRLPEWLNEWLEQRRAAENRDSRQEVILEILREAYQQAPQ